MNEFYLFVSEIVLIGFSQILNTLLKEIVITLLEKVIFKFFAQ